MERACYGKGGELVTPQEFIRRASPRYKERGIFPYCEACGQKVELYGVHNPEGPSRFDHPNLPDGVDPLDDCVLAKRNNRFKGMQPTGFDENHGKELRDTFFQDEFIKRTYCFMWRMCGIGNFPFKKFEEILHRADAKRIWAYSKIELWSIPYILLTLANFIHKNKYEFHFYIDKNKSSSINEIWENEGRTHIYKVLSISGIKFDYGQIENPVEISRDTFDKYSVDCDFLTENFLNYFRKFR